MGDTKGDWMANATTPGNSSKTMDAFGKGIWILYIKKWKRQWGHLC